MLRRLGNALRRVVTQLARFRKGDCTLPFTHPRTIGNIGPQAQALISSKTLRNGGSGARHMVRYVSRKEPNKNKSLAESSKRPKILRSRFGNSSGNNRQNSSLRHRPVAMKPEPPLTPKPQPPGRLPFDQVGRGGRRNRRHARYAIAVEAVIGTAARRTPFSSGVRHGRNATRLGTAGDIAHELKLGLLEAVQKNAFWFGRSTPPSAPDVFSIH
jgi:hypothetical protein